MQSFFVGIVEGNCSNRHPDTFGQCYRRAFMTHQAAKEGPLFDPHIVPRARYGSYAYPKALSGRYVKKTWAASGHSVLRACVFALLSFSCNGLAASALIGEHVHFGL